MEKEMGTPEKRYPHVTGSEQRGEDKGLASVEDLGRKEKRRTAASG